MSIIVIKVMHVVIIAFCLFTIIENGLYKYKYQCTSDSCVYLPSKAKRACSQICWPAAVLADALSGGEDVGMKVYFLYKHIVPNSCL